MEVSKPKYLGRFSKIVEDNGGKYLVGDGITVADVYLCYFLAYWEKFFKLDFTSGFPVIQNMIKQFESNPKIRNWHETSPKVPDFNAEILVEMMQKKMGKK